VEQRELLQYLASVLDDLAIEYFITGSMATIVYGRARQTNDIDVVAAIPPEKVIHFCSRFSDDAYYVSEDAAREAIRRHAQFNIIHDSGYKIDVNIPDRSAFSRSRLARRVRTQIGPDDTPGNRPFFSTPEDIILKKMDFYREGRSEKHLTDINNVLITMGDRLDRSYIDDWVSMRMI
jgi:hypothetical protein